jgi:hypothetical protein
MASKPEDKPETPNTVDVFEIQPGPPRESLIDRKQTGCCEEAQADGVCCSNPRNTCETCGRSVVDFSRHTCPSNEKSE